MSNTTMAAAPYIADVDTDSPEFQAALAKAGKILANSPLRDVVNVYSLHDHFPWNQDEIHFEESVGPQELELYPLSSREGAERGLPSCWRVTAEGELVVRRYADKVLHERSGFDVTDATFLAELAKIGKAFAEAGIHDYLELNVAGKLFPAPAGQVTQEVTDEASRRQSVTIGLKTALGAGETNVPACWHFTPSGEAMVTGFCINCPDDDSGGK